jgi:uncharacterized protein (TIGR02301 family)
MWSVRILAALGAWLCLTGLAWSQERPPEDRQVLTDLAFNLGQAHALRQTCLGETDQTWRMRMLQLSEQEAADVAFDAQFKSRFNAGFAVARAEQPACNASARSALAQIAAKAQSLAAKLAAAVRPTARPAVADPYAVAPGLRPKIH